MLLEIRQREMSHKKPNSNPRNYMYGLFIHLKAHKFQSAYEKTGWVQFRRTKPANLDTNFESAVFKSLKSASWQTQVNNLWKPNINSQADE